MQVHTFQKVWFSLYLREKTSLYKIDKIKFFIILDYKQVTLHKQNKTMLDQFQRIKFSLCICKVS